MRSCLFSRLILVSAILFLLGSGVSAYSEAHGAKLGVKSSLLFGISVEGEYGLTEALSVYGEYGATLYSGYQAGVRWYPKASLAGPMVGLLFGEVRNHPDGLDTTRQIELGYTLVLSESAYASGSVGILHTGRSMPQLSVGMRF